MAPFAYTGSVTGRWMMRNFALTLAGVMLRVESPLLSGLGLDFAVAYQIVA